MMEFGLRRNARQRCLEKKSFWSWVLNSIIFHCFYDTPLKFTSVAGNNIREDANSRTGGIIVRDMARDTAYPL